MTNLPDFLRELLEKSRTAPNGRVFINPAQRVFIESYLRESVDEIHFRARPTGQMLKTPQGLQPEVEQHYLIRGHKEEIVNLMTEAAIRNPHFLMVCQEVARLGIRYLAESRQYQESYGNACEEPTASWEFSPLNNHI